MDMELVRNKNEIENCTYAKALLMIVIVFYHSIVFWTGDWFSIRPNIQCNFLDILAQWMNSFHIYAFTLVSGYIYYYGKYENGKYCDFREFVLVKVKRLLIPFYFVSIVWASWVNYIFFHIDCIDFIKKFIFAESPNQLWFLFMLFDVFIICFCLSNAFHKSFTLGLIVSIGLFVIGVL